MPLLQPVFGEGAFWNGYAETGGGRRPSFFALVDKVVMGGPARAAVGG